MKTYLALFKCAKNSPAHKAWMQLDEQAQKDRFQKGTFALDEWKAKYKDQIIFDGGYLGEVTKLVDNQGVRDIPSQMGIFMIVKANSHEDAAKMFLDHPHFAIFPGDGVEIVERLDAPRDVGL